MTSWIKRALPFIITLIVGTGLGNIFGIHKPATSGGDTRRARCAKQRSFDNASVSPHNNGSTQLKILYQPSTRYTPEALKNQTTGVVKLLVRFKADGTTTVVERLFTLSDGLTEDAERVAEQTRFTPATVDGTPVTEMKVMNYIYSISVRDTNDR